VAKKRGKKEEAKEELPEEPPTIIPLDQLKLSAKELDEDFPRVLTASNPCHPHNLVSFNYATKAYTPVPTLPEDDVFFHVKQMAKTLHKDGEECKAQVAAQTSFKESVKAKRDARAQAALEEGKELTQAELEEDDTQRNQFNFTERATQTYNATIKSRVISTTPPDSANAVGSMTQWALHDAYVLEYERIVAMMNMEKLAKEAKTAAKAVAAGGALKAKDSDNPMHTPEMAARLAIMERIVNQVRCFLPAPEGGWHCLVGALLT
jgi:dynein intermediate chain 1